MMRPPRTNATPGDQQHDGNDDHDDDADGGDDDIYIMVKYQSAKVLKK